MKQYIIRYNKAVDVFDGILLAMVRNHKDISRYNVTDTEYERIANIDDYESFAYHVVDDRQVIITDSISGDVYRVMTANKFLSETMKECKRTVY